MPKNGSTQFCNLISHELRRQYACFILVNTDSYVGINVSWEVLSIYLKSKVVWKVVSCKESEQSGDYSIFIRFEYVSKYYPNIS